MKKSGKTTFVCQACGAQAPRWLGKCPDCEAWDSFVEELQPVAKARKAHSADAQDRHRPVALDAVVSEEYVRLLTGMAEFDRVLGGGLVDGSMVLIGGDPGIGKSTLMLQVMCLLACQGHPVLYVSGEESTAQLRLRATRLATFSPHLLVASQTDVDDICATAARIMPRALVVDSIQTAYSAEITSAPGSVSQVRQAAMRLMLLAKNSNIPIFLVGHVTKEGAIAGPRLLEHMVDTVLYFEGDSGHIFRILRAVKNRFGSTNEIGVFEMREQGLVEVSNPSALFLGERPVGAPGSVVTTCMEGTRPMLLELQALACGTAFGTPRRTILGLDPHRVALLAAVMEKNLGMPLLTHDIFMNVVGGLRVNEPAVDLAIIAAIASSFLDKPLPAHTMVFGEVGLTGEIRRVNRAEMRVAESTKMGFNRCVMPVVPPESPMAAAEMEIVGLKHISQAMEALF